MTDSRYQIVVEPVGVLTGAWANHKVIEVSAPGNLHATLAENLNIQRWAAGVIGRLALLLTEDIEAQVAACGCPSVCRIQPSGLVVTKTSLITDYSPPDLVLYLRRDDIPRWTKLITTKLADINRADRWQPTKADERTWLGEPATSHYAVPHVHVEAPTR